MDLWSRWQDVASARPEAPALQLEDGTERSHGRLLADARAFAAALAARGVGRGDRVALWLGNREETVLAYLGSLALGAVTVPMNLAYRRQEVAHLLADAEPRLLLLDADQQAVLDEIGADVTASVAVCRVEELAADAQAKALAAVDPTAATPPIGADDLAMLLYTSGTTGRSKGAMLTHDNLLATIEALQEAWRWQASDRLLLTLPIFHTHGLVVGLLTALLSGAAVRLRRRFDAAAVLGELGAGAATLFFGVPTMYVRLVDALRGGAPRPRGVRLFCSGSAPLPADVLLAFREATGATILERYGMTETGMLLSNPHDGERRAGTVGMPLPGVSLRIVDAGGADVADDQEGELVVRGRNVFAGYWRDEEKTRASFLVDDAGRRWFRTGDVGRRDLASGHVTLLGRSRELILRGGFNVYPREVEEALLAFPGVREAAVVGRPHADWGEVPVAFVATDGELDEAALLGWCGQQLARFKVPVAVHRVDALPRNAMGKVQKDRLPAMPVG
jgi:malonyl-CoA/methylmalonyl-CoA synthetase